MDRSPCWWLRAHSLGCEVVLVEEAKDEIVIERNNSIFFSRNKVFQKCIFMLPSKIYLYVKKKKRRSKSPLYICL